MCECCRLVPPPIVIWDPKTLSPELCDGEVLGTVYGLSDWGWIDEELFNIWFSNHFLAYAPCTRPLLNLLDWHSSHCCPETVRLVAAEEVIVFALPPNTTHLTQPLDKCCLGPLKICWKEVHQDYMKKNPGKFLSGQIRTGTSWGVKRVSCILIWASFYSSLQSC